MLQFFQAVATIFMENGYNVYNSDTRFEAYHQYH